MFTKAGCTKAAVIMTILLLVIAGTAYYVMTRKPPEVAPEPPSSYESQVRIGITKRTANLPFYAINSLIKGKGYEIVLVPVDDLSSAWERLGAGSLDMLIAPLDAVTLGIVRHKPGFIVFRAAGSEGSDAVVGQKEITSLEECTGKKAALVPGSSGYLLFSILQDRAGKTIQDCDTLYVENQAQALACLQEGRVDAAVLSDPYLQDALDKKFRIIASTSTASLVEDYCVVSRKMKEAYPDRVRDVVKAWFEILEILQKNPGMGKRLISKSAGIEPARIDQLLGRIRFSSIHENKEIADRDIIKKMGTYQKFWSLENEPNAHLPVDFKGFLDFTFVRDLSPDDIQSVFVDDTPSASPPPLPSVTMSPAVPVPVPTNMVTPGVSPSPEMSGELPIE